jgi:Retrotransposon gag protein
VWDKLCGKFPVSETNQADIVAHAFSGQAAAVYQQVAAANPMATAEELWVATERRLQNAAQVQSQRGKVYEARMKRGESVEKFAERLRELACGLPESIDDHVLQQRLIAGLPDYLKVPAATASTDFDTAVTQLELVMEAMSTGANKRRYGGGEQVNEVREVQGGGRGVDANGGEGGGGLGAAPRKPSQVSERRQRLRDCKQ